MESIILENVGKKIRNGFLNGTISSSKVMDLYRRNKKEAEAFSSYGYTVQELCLMLKTCHNPLLCTKLLECIALRNTKSVASSNQNKLSLEKLDAFKQNALGVGLRKVLSVLKHESRKSKDFDLKIVTLLLELEFANLSAKNHGKSLKGTIYERKDLLLQEIACKLDGSNWKFGYNDNCGKNAYYLVFVYLPNGVQLSWHCNDYNTVQGYPYVECEWDGLVCSTMDKILSYIADRYGSYFH